MSKNFIDIDIKGMKKFQRKLKKFEKNVKEATKPKKIPVSTLLTDAFIKKYTAHKTFTGFILNSGIVTKLENISEEDLNSSEFDKYVKNSTKFSSWKEMLEQAAIDYYQKQLGFK